MFIIVIGTLLLWFPIGAWIVRQDQKRQLGTKGSGDDVVFVPTRKKFG